MPIKLEITDAELLPPSVLKQTAAYLMLLAGFEIEPETVTPKVGDQEKTVTTTSLAPADTEASTTAEDHLVQLDNVGLVETPIDPGARVSDDPAAVFGGEDPKPAGVVAPTPLAPVAPVAPTAPAPTAPVAPTPNSAIVTDKAGLPWDRRIHSESKSINKTDGLWRTKRGVDETLVAEVVEELRKLMALSVADAPKPGLDPSPTAATAPVAPVAPTAPAPLATEQASTIPKNLGELMIAAQGLVASGKIASLDAVRAVAAELGVPALPLLGTRPDMVAAVYNKLIEG